MASTLTCRRTVDPEARWRRRNQLVERHMPLVKYVFGKMSLYYPNHLGKEDLTSSGVIGLMKAVEEYDPKAQTQFSTFAIPRIRGAILDELRAHDWVPRSVKRKMRSLQSARTKLDRHLSGAHSETHLAKAMSLSQRQLHKALALSTPVTFVSLGSADSEASDHDTVSLAESLKNPKVQEPFADIASEEEETSLGQSILQLSDPDRLVVTLHYYRGMMLKDIARVLKLSKSRVSQIHKHALTRLKVKMKGFHPVEVS